MIHPLVARESIRMIAWLTIGLLGLLARQSAAQEQGPKLAEPIAEGLCDLAGPAKDVGDKQIRHVHRVSADEPAARSLHEALFHAWPRSEDAEPVSWALCLSAFMEGKTPVKG